MLKSLDNAVLQGVIVGLDRQESLSNQPDGSRESAVSALSKEFGIAINSIINVEHLITYLSKPSEKMDADESSAILDSMQQYRARFGC
jgi:orotate phosphoribosyltransferase